VVGGGFQVGVAEELLDGADIHSVANEMGGKGVPQHVRCDALDQAGSGEESPERTVQEIRRQPLTLRAEEKACAS